MKTERTPERLVFFADAVVAIALTLLVLPLTEVVPEIVAAHGHSIDAITRTSGRSPASCSASWSSPGCG